MQSKPFSSGTNFSWPSFANIQRGTYNETQVRIKLVKRCGKKCINRDVRKELKILRSDIHHPNINRFIGAHVHSDNTMLLLTVFCPRGSLQDILAEREEIQLDLMWLTSFISDLVQGMHYLHYSTPLGLHGNLRSSNCLVTNR